METNQEWKHKVPIHLYILFVIVGYAPWLLVNAIYLELPIFFLETPETNQIASFISLSIQTANCLMIFYLLFNWRFPAMKVHWIILGLLCSSLIFSIFLGTFWELTLQIGDSSYSIVLFITSFIAGGIGSISNVTFWPFVSNYHPNLLNGLSVGMGLSGILPSIFVFIQNAGEDPRFSVKVYFLITGVLVFISIISFIAIIKMKTSKLFLKQKQIRWSSIKSEDEYNNENYDETESILQKNKSPSNYTLSSIYNERQQQLDQTYLIESKRNFYFFLAITFYISSLHFFLPGLTTFLVKGFNNSPHILLLFNTLGMIGGTIGRFISLFVERIRFILIPPILSILFSLFFIFGSPVNVNAVVLIITNILFSFVFGFGLTMIYKVNSNSENAQVICKWIGVFEQLGALTGSLVCFLLTFYNVIKY